MKENPSIAVIGGNYEVFHNLCKKLGLKRNEVVFFNSASVGRGRIFDRMIATCGYQHHMKAWYAFWTCKGPNTEIEYISCCALDTPPSAFI